MGLGILPAAALGMLCAALTGTLTGSVTVAWRIPSFIVSWACWKWPAARPTS